MEKKSFLILLLCAFGAISLVLNLTLAFILINNAHIYQQNAVNKKVLEFRNMFTEKILLSDRDIDFDTRLLLETAVRELNDTQIFDRWKKFTDSQTKEEATMEAKQLLQLLIQKTSVAHS